MIWLVSCTWLVLRTNFVYTETYKDNNETLNLDLYSYLSISTSGLGDMTDEQLITIILLLQQLIVEIFG